ITAELQGQVTYVPPKQYTGVPLRVILQEAVPLDGAKKVKIIATDGYLVELDLQDVLNDGQMLLIREGDMLRLIAGNYEGGYWVKMVNKIVVE
ncbi:MAG: molybdopterin-dependent oxidoreductase, partial [bacterium]